MHMWSRAPTVKLRGYRIGTSKTINGAMNRNETSANKLGEGPQCIILTLVLDRYLVLADIQYQGWKRLFAFHQGKQITVRKKEKKEKKITRQEIIRCYLVDKLTKNPQHKNQWSKKTTKKSQQITYFVFFLNRLSMQKTVSECAYPILVPASFTFTHLCRFVPCGSLVPTVLNSFASTRIS